MKYRRRLLLAAWLILATFVLTRLTLTHPDVGPRIPEPIAIWLANAYGAQNAEDIADLETLVVLAASFIIVSAITASTYLGWRRFWKRDASHLT